jgi:hypothetical protein
MYLAHISRPLGTLPLPHPNLSEHVLIGAQEAGKTVMVLSGMCDGWWGKGSGGRLQRISMEGGALAPPQQNTTQS